jgi:hypothetical protein
MAFGLGRGGRELTLKLVADTSAIKGATQQTAAGVQKLNGAVAGIGAAFASIKGVDAFLGFLGSAAEGAAADEKQVRLLMFQVENLGIAAEQAEPAIDGMVAAWARMGRTDTEVRAALGRALDITQNLTTAQNLANTAMDVATTLGIDQAEATDLVAKAVDGKEKALFRLLGAYDEDWSATDRYIAIQGRFRGATAKSVKGIDKLKVGVGEAVDSIGDWVNSGIEGWSMLADRVGFWADVVKLEATGVGDQYETLLSDINAINNDAVRAQWDTVSELNAVNRAAAAEAAQTASDIAGGLEDGLDKVKPVKIELDDFWQLKFDTFASDFVDAAIKVLTAPSAKAEFDRLWPVLQKYGFNPKTGQLNAAGQQVMGALSSSIANGKINPSDIGKPIGKALSNFQFSDRQAQIMEDKLLGLFPGKVTPTIKVEPKWKGGGFSRGVISGSITLRPQSFVPIAGSIPAASAASAVVVNINTGVGDPVVIGREVSRVLGAYSTRSGHV